MATRLVQLALPSPHHVLELRQLRSRLPPQTDQFLLHAFRDLGIIARLPQTGFLHRMNWALEPCKHHRYRRA